MNCIFKILLLFPGILSVSGIIKGGFNDMDPNDYTELSWKYVPQINNNTNGDNYFVPIKVLKAQIQVVSGTNTVLEVLVGESSCSKSNANLIVSQANCPLKTGGKREIYKVQIWEKPWTNFEKITVEKVRDVKDGEQLE